MAAKKAATKKVAKKTTKKKVATKKKASPKKRATTKTEIVVRVSQDPIVPTVSDLSDPMKDGKKLTIPQTWLTDKQLLQMVQKTPPQHIYRRKGKGGQEFDYVTGSYVEKALNFIFAWNWDFIIDSHGREGNFVWVLGKLIVRGNKPGQEIVKTQFGRAEIKYKKGSKDMLDFGNDLKAAATDSLKKCASLLGIAGDIYGKQDYKQETGVNPKDNTPEEVADDENEKVIGPDGKPTYTCDTCGDPISKSGRDYTKRIFKKALCREHAEEEQQRRKNG